MTLRSKSPRIYIMSFLYDHARITCDGKGCCRTAIEPMPDVVKRGSGAYTVIRPDSKCAEGWLFVLEGTNFRHYCPVCTRQMLPLITQEMKR
jgi:hypothetical protein